MTDCTDAGVLRAFRIEAFAQLPVGALTAMVPGPGETVACVRLDCFDQSLRRSGRMLLEHDGGLEVIRADGSGVVQDGAERQRFVADLPEGPVKAALADMSPLRCLLPLGAVTLGRQTLAYVDGDRKTRCRAQIVTLTGATGDAVAWITPQGFRGYDKALADLIQVIRDCGAEPMTMDQVCATIFPQRTVYQARPDVPLSKDQPAHAAATRIIASYIPVARQNEAGIIADLDTEFLHDYRVALRKVRSVLSLFKGVYQVDQTAALKARFSALMARTGPLRDLDVFGLEQPGYRALVPGGLQAGLDAMADLRAVDRAAALTTLARHLNGAAYAAEMADLDALFAAPDRLQPGPKAATGTRDLVAGLIWKRFRKAAQAAARIGPHSPDAEVHALRIHLKKLRYLLEFSTGLFAKGRLKAATRMLKGLQDNLGQVNDLSVQLASLDSFMAGAGAWPDRVKLSVAQSVGALIAVLHQRKLDLRAETAPQVAAFAAAETDQTFRALIGKPRS